jgi:hypothetical protein
MYRGLTLCRLLKVHRHPPKWKSSRLRQNLYVFSFGCYPSSLISRCKWWLELENKTNFIKVAESPPAAPEEEIKEPEPVRTLIKLTIVPVG